MNKNDTVIIIISLICLTLLSIGSFIYHGMADEADVKLAEELVYLTEKNSLLLKAVEDLAARVLILEDIITNTYKEL